MSQSTLAHASDSPLAEQDSAPAEAPAEIVRFDIHQRLQHGLMATSFILLVLTGWPLSSHGIGASHVLVSLFGGMTGCGIVHRVAAGGLILASLYHLVHLGAMLKRRKLTLAMLPGRKDLRDVIDNFRYFFGLRSERPRFPKYSYFEKFDYWAVFWGVAIMVGSGLIRWFPDVSTKILPAWAYEIAYFAHADEALLAALAIFVWHFYNVHLRPGVFPMSKVFITGRLTLEQLEEEHGAQYDQLMAERAAARATADDDEAKS